MATNKNKHLTLEDRAIIQKGIINGATKTAIAMTLNKDKSTIGKEIRLHRILKHRCRLPLECVNYPKCRHSRKCTKECPDYKAFICKRRDRTPGACNGCDHYSSCRFDKYFYDATDAELAYPPRVDMLKRRFQYILRGDKKDRKDHCETYQEWAVDRTSLSLTSR